MYYFRCCMAMRSRVGCPFLSWLFLFSYTHPDLAFRSLLLSWDGARMRTGVHMEQRAGIPGIAFFVWCDIWALQKSLGTEYHV
ncbi:uncharacterized protein F4817DRAFT_333689 [Daldinia loculata]|uniref:uncharacterized protein n=1 Tax=Daldinia loculata TaxID=103429 RepID=UPI0020C4293D|nr:uncharacterized protein F4817DRAFT_333689 [Daldinia loculata]KAI1648664.1 hypothetical protein F4817DRAFT_333689 [Daldinia loculata]